MPTEYGFVIATTVILGVTTIVVAAWLHFQLEDQKSSIVRTLRHFKRNH